MRGEVQENVQWESFLLLDCCHPETERCQESWKGHDEEEVKEQPRRSCWGSKLKQNQSAKETIEKWKKLQIPLDAAVEVAARTVTL